MTLLDAPKYDEVRERHHKVILLSAVGLVLVLFVGWWMVAGRPVDWPWNWNNHLRARMEANQFLTAVEKNDMATAYGVWIHDKNWQRHQSEFGSYPYDKFLADRGYAGKQDTLDKDLAKKLSEDYGKSVHDKDWKMHLERISGYPFNRFQKDWSPTSSENEYGVIQSHKIVAARMYGNVLLMAILINDRKSKALNIDYDPKTHALNFSPPDVEIYLGSKF